METTAAIEVETAAWDWDLYDELMQPAYTSYTILAPFIIIIGTTGNLLTVVVMLRPALRRTVTSVYLIALALVDTACLLTGLLRWWIIHTFNHDIRSHSEFSCKLQFYLVYALPQYEAWILVSVSIERFVAIFFPIKAKEWFTHRRVAVGLAVLAVVLGFLNIHFFFHVHHYYEQEYFYCGLPEDHLFSEYSNNIHPWLDLLLQSFLPFCVLMITNIAIATKIIRMQARKGQMQGSSSNTRKAPISSITVTMMICCMIFLVTTLPMAVFLAAQDVWSNPIWENEDSLGLANFYKADIALQLIYYSNFAINFFTYTLGSARFRRELCLMCRKKASSRVDATTTMVTTV